MSVTLMALKLLSERNKKVDDETFMKIVQRAEANINLRAKEPTFAHWLYVEESINYHCAPKGQDKQFMGKYSAK